MSVPTSEIPEERQTQARESVDAASWGALPSAIQDKLMRALDRGRDSSAIDAYRALVGAPGSASASYFSQLTEPQQNDVLDTLALRPDEMHGLALDTAIGSIRVAQLPGDVQTRAVDVATKPLDSRREGDRDDRRGMVQFYLRDQFERLMALSDTVMADGFAAASPADKNRVLDVLDVCGASGFGAFPAALDKSSTPPSWSHRTASTAPFFDRDLKNEGTLLDHIHALTAGAFHERVQIGMPYREVNSRRRRPGDPPGRPRVRRFAVQYRVRDIGDELSGAGAQIDRAFVVGDLLAEAVLPSWTINQDNRGTCEATSMLRQLAIYSPAEFARLGKELVVRSRATLQDNSDFPPPADAYPVDDSLRSVTERLMQSAMMRYWRSGTVPQGTNDRTDLYRNVSRRRRTDGTNPTGAQSDQWLGRYDPALDDRDVERALTALFGVRHVTIRQNAVSQLRAELAARPERPVLTCLDWGIARDGTRDGHCIVVLEIQPGPPERVLFWNPWGAPTSVLVTALGVVGPNGQLQPPSRGSQNESTRALGGVGHTGDVQRSRRGGPVRHTETGAIGLQWMTMSDLRLNMRTIHVPRSS